MHARVHQHGPRDAIRDQGERPAKHGRGDVFPGDDIDPAEGGSEAVLRTTISATLDGAVGLPSTVYEDHRVSFDLEYIQESMRMIAQSWGSAVFIIYMEY